MQISVAGLRQRPNFGAILDFVANTQETVKYPDRTSRLKNHPYLMQLEDIGMMEMEVQRENALKEQDKEQSIAELEADIKRLERRILTMDSLSMNFGFLFGAVENARLLKLKMELAKKKAMRDKRKHEIQFKIEQLKNELSQL